MNPDDFFSGYGFMVYIGPVFALINSIISLPNTILSAKGYKRVGFVIWILTLMGVLAYWISRVAGSGSNQRINFIAVAIHIGVFWVLPQIAAYSFSQKQPWVRPLIAGGVALGVAILFFTLGVLLGATPD